MPSSLARPESTSVIFKVAPSFSHTLDPGASGSARGRPRGQMFALHDDRRRRRRNAEPTLETMQHGLRASDHLLGEGEPLGVGQEHTARDFYRLDRLGDAAAKQALLMAGRGLL